MVAQRIPGNPIIIETVLDENRKLIVDLPPDTPTGQVEVQLIVRQITPAVKDEENPVWRAEYERLKAKLAAAGALSTIWQAPEDNVELTEEELWKLGDMPPGAPTSEQLIREDRGEY